MKQLKTIEDRVRLVLKTSEEARNNDMFLYLKVCDACINGIGVLPLATVMTGYREFGLPPFESVRRTRQKLQATYPELAGSLRTQRQRAKQEQVYRQYIKEV